VERPTDETDHRARETGTRQALFREVNERIDELAEASESTDEVTILCEYALAGCSERIALDQEAYENLRRIPTRFAVIPGHVIPSVERVVERHDEFVVVEKFGASAKVAIQLDPRRRTR
jgi:hypothetical protein